MELNIRNEIELLAFLESLIDSEENEIKVTGLRQVKYIDSGKETNEFINEFYNNAEGDKSLCLFLELYEGNIDLGDSRDGYLMTCTLVCLALVPDEKSITLLNKRKLTRESLLNVIGCFRTAEQMAREDENAASWEFRQDDGRLMQTGEMGNSKAYGYLTNFEIWIESGKIIYRNI